MQELARWLVPEFAKKRFQSLYVLLIRFAYAVGLALLEMVGLFLLVAELRGCSVPMHNKGTWRRANWSTGQERRSWLQAVGLEAFGYVHIPRLLI
jgi:hypothetical protein